MPKQDEIRTIAVLGAGHGGCAAAADLTLRGYTVKLQARREERLRPLREKGGIEIEGGVHNAFVPLAHLTTEVAEAVEGADLIMLAVPSVAHADYARQLAPLLSPDRIVYLNPGHTGGCLHFVHALRGAGYREDVQTCETITLTYICRMQSPAKVRLMSYIRKLGWAAFPGRLADRLFSLVHPIFPETVRFPNVLVTGLSDMNAVFHPPGMLMNAGWIESTGGDFLFYHEGVTESVGRVTAAVDAERMAVAVALGVETRSFLETFHAAGLTTDEALASGNISRACRESGPNKTVRSPSSLDDRYIHEDVGYGLVPYAELGRLAGVPTPTIDAHIHLASLATGIPYRESGLTLEKMGIAGMQPAGLARYVEEGR
jgi:opine dehydrogenase